MEKDALKEIVNIAAGNAGTALSHMLGKKIDMDIPETFIGNVVEVQKKVGNEKDLMLAVFFKIHGDISGALAIFFPEKTTLEFTKILLKSDLNGFRELKEEQLSAIREVGNILLGASASAISKFLDMAVIQSIPDTAVDMLGAIMDNVLLEMSDTEENVLLLKTELSVKEYKASTNLFYIFDPASTGKILEKMAKLAGS